MKYIKYILSIAISVLVVSAVVYAGSLTPPGSVTNTMYTLEDIYNLTQSATTTEGSGSIPSTPGTPSATFHTLTDIYEAIEATPKAKLLQTFGTSNYCTNSSGTVIDCAGTGLDGQYRAGIPKSYTDNGDLTITDNNTGLMWMKCSVGQSGSDCGTGTATGMRLNQATSTCEILSLASYSDWRLPNFNEIFSLFNFDGYPSISATYFPQAVQVNSGGSRHYWSSTRSVIAPNKWYAITYSNNAEQFTGLSPYDANGPSVRCVRGGL